ncbi:MAG: hypothetical protein ACFCUM_15420 [Bacteroidales bacterium]
MNRRNFFTAAGRYLLFGSLVTVAAVTMNKKGDNEGTCPTDKFCSRCGILSSCSLPEAIREKEDREEYPVIGAREDGV